ncbi:MAG: hypothetical protein AAF986_04385 [Pseudomonadota bacterium]
MSETERIDIGQDGVNEALQEVEQEAEATLRETLTPLAAEMKELFGEVRDSIVQDLKQAAQDGKLTIDELLDSIVTRLSQQAAEQYIQVPVESIFNRTIEGALGPVPDQQNTMNRSESQVAAVAAKGISQAGRNG